MARVEDLVGSMGRRLAFPGGIPSFGPLYCVLRGQRSLKDFLRKKDNSLTVISRLPNQDTLA